MVARLKQAASDELFTHAQQLLGRITSPGDMGTRYDEIPSSQAALLQQLEDSALVFRVSCWDHIRVVARQHIRIWCVRPDPNSDANAVIVRPWLMLNGELNVSLLADVRLKLLSAVLARPGIPEELLIEELSPVLGPQDVRDLLTDLETLGAVASKLIETRSVGLFGPLQGNSQRCYHPCIMLSSCA